MYPVNRNEMFSPKKSFYIRLRASTSDDRARQVRARIIGDGGELADGREVRVNGEVVIRGRAPVKMLERIERMHRDKAWFNDVVEQIVFGQDVWLGPPPLGELRPRVQSCRSLRLRVLVRSFDLDASLDPVYTNLRLGNINIEQLYIDRRTGTCMGLLDVHGEAERILAMERAVFERRWYPELDPAAHLSEQPFRRCDVGHTETITGVGRGSRPGLYENLRHYLAKLVSTISVHAEEVPEISPEENDPFRFTATFSFTPDLTREEAVGRLHAALTEWGVEYKLKPQRALWVPIDPGRPPAAGVEGGK